jgi:IMP cyclohydrolase
MDFHESAAANFERHLVRNSYPGRVLVIGRAADGSWLQIYAIMGRSERSRNRRFVADGPTLRTEAVDRSKIKDPSLIIYRAMAELPGVYLVTNGDQTDTIVDALRRAQTFEAALATREREPDSPNYTPRISGMLDARGGGPEVALSLLRANDADPEQTDRVSTRPAAPPPGYGYLLSVYQSDGSPLPPFRGDPLPVPLSGSAEQILDRYWSALDEQNRIALAVKQISDLALPGSISLRNRFS